MGSVIMWPTTRHAPASDRASQVAKRARSSCGDLVAIGVAPPSHWHSAICDPIDALGKPKRRAPSPSQQKGKKRTTTTEVASELRRGSASGNEFGQNLVAIHSGTFTTSKMRSSSPILPTENDIPPATVDNVGMAKKQVKIDYEDEDSLRPMPRLFIAEWMDALKLTPKDIAEKAGMTVGYLSQLSYPERQKVKKNPSFTKIYYLAAAMELRIDDILNPPPPRGIIEEIHKLSPAIVDRLRDRR